MSIVTLLPFIVLIGAMFLMTRSAKKKQQAAAQMRDEMQPGTGVRTIGGMYATVKEIGDETVLLEVAPGVHAVYAKNAIGAVLEDSEYNRIVHGDDEESDSETVVPDDASSLTEAPEAADAKTAEVEDAAPKADLTKKSDAAEAATEGQKDGKADGETDAK
ncbi:MULTISPECIES: preprotein translocase subunit YajC [Streptomyces]|uniref:Preprotein translocase subunit YajC n=1 Tax=Streptomyces venezuelae (strain ATCC 10712 / CBS 650.69 / DSM 40230 / JCM 4526 / NBRC 13096 / PD 04745) TaxID=953739 RepID=F2RCP6_STRVP|nr:preprotein translocase subunit YajC [Streptomyces venezuelae]APE20503.1 preprotein translocase subunit YajC [Streptomyces venezuelae]QER97896.1 preprotein translocase subunit YajC [Streptomyces venezuelae ATCC 10712]CCA54404.1 Preprotein translocase subunit YajC [Streptomyces venezuelae ATCC 10712]